jgi:hypothetical protein
MQLEAYFRLNNLQGRRLRQTRTQHEAFLFTPYFMPPSCLAYSSTLKMEATYPSETLVGFQRITERYISQDRTLHNHLCDSLI